MQTRSRTLAVRALSAMDTSPFRLGVDELRELIVGNLDQDDVFAFACACRLFRAATCQRGSAAARFPSGVRTRHCAAWASPARLRWALGLGYTMTARHFAEAAGAPAGFCRRILPCWSSARFEKDKPRHTISPGWIP